MSAQAPSGVPGAELAVMQRIQQLQTLIESTRRVAAGMPASAATEQGQGSDFASALQSATSATAATGAGAAAVSDSSGVVGSTSMVGFQATPRPARAQKPAPTNRWSRRPPRATGSTRPCSTA